MLNLNERSISEYSTTDFTSSCLLAGNLVFPLFLHFQCFPSTARSWWTLQAKRLPSRTSKLMMVNGTLSITSTWTIRVTRCFWYLPRFRTSIHVGFWSTSSHQFRKRRANSEILHHLRSSRRLQPLRRVRSSCEVGLFALMIFFWFIVSLLLNLGIWAILFRCGIARSTHRCSRTWNRIIVAWKRRFQGPSTLTSAGQFLWFFYFSMMLIATTLL